MARLFFAVALHLFSTTTDGDLLDDVAVKLVKQLELYFLV